MSNGFVCFALIDSTKIGSDLTKNFENKVDNFKIMLKKF